MVKLKAMHYVFFILNSAPGNTIKLGRMEYLVI